MLMIAYGSSGHFFAFNSEGEIWDTTANAAAGGYVVSVDGDVANYRIAPESSLGTKHTATAPVDVDHYDFRAEAATLSDSPVLYEREPPPLRAVDEGRRLNVSINGNAGIGFSSSQIAGLAGLGTQLDLNGVESIIPSSADANADALLDRADALGAGITPRKLIKRLRDIFFAKTSNDGKTVRNLEDTDDAITVQVSGKNRTGVTPNWDA